MGSHRLSVRVYYEDTDLGGVVYYANYLRFIERGRSEALRALGIDQVALKAAGLLFVVRRLSAEYLSPARYDDLLEVMTAIEEVGGATVGMVQEVRRDGVALFRARVQVACMDSGGKPRRLPTEVRAALVKDRDGPPGPDETRRAGQGRGFPPEGGSRARETVAIRGGIAYRDG